MTRFGIVLGTAALLAWSALSRAATLDQEACARLKTELMQLELAGTRTNMTKGPEWAKTNLASDKLQQIKRLLDVEEQILFRCQGKPLVVLPESVDAEPASAERKDGAPAKPSAVGKDVGKDGAPAAGKAQGKAAMPAPSPNAQAGAPTAKAPAAKSAPTKAASEAPPAAPKPKPKPKVEDAYKPAPAAPAGLPAIKP